jgi:hypothetical protein
MYMSQHAFTPVPSKLELWVPYNRNYMTLTGRVAGAVLSRILREVLEPEKFFALGVWTSHDMAVQWTNSAESKLGAKPNIDLGLYDGYPMTWSRWNLVDFAWGPEGPAEVDGSDAVAKIVTWDVAPGMREAQDAYNRAILSALARQPGFICGETYLGHRGDRYQLIFTLKRAGDWPPAVGMPLDLRMVMEADTFREVREKTPAQKILDCTIWQWVWGPEQARLRRFPAAAARDGGRAARGASA